MLSDLQHFPLDQRPPSAIVAYDRGKPITWSQWLTDLLSLRQRLVDEPSGYWAIHYADTYPAALALFALWSSGRTPILLPDAAPHTLAGITVEVAGHMSDHALDLNNYVTVAGHEPPVDSPAHLELNCQVVMQTSGSTGTPLVVVKTHHQLISEALYYAEHWHSGGSVETFAATVSHQHIYGLLFKLLVPMAAGHSFVSELLNNPRQLLSRYRAQNLVWVASPAQLKRTTPDILADLTTSNIIRIYSSGGLLDAESAATVRAIFPEPAFEIYGSTETGGIGWRQQKDRPSNPWQLLNSVEGRQNPDGLLEVCSSYTEHEWTTTGDRVELLAAQQFNLQGRADKVVKVEEKRVSLTALENTLQQSEQVTDARVFMLEQGRQQLAAVVVLSAGGVKELLNSGRKAVVGALKGALANVHAAHEVPRRFRFVSELPQNAQGKTTLAALSGEFETGQRDTLPYVESVIVNDEPPSPYDPEVVLNLLVPPDLEYFANHFADYPVLPGVVQLLWVRHYARLHLGISGDTQKMTQVKFKSMIHPGEAVTMRLRWRADKGSLLYQIQSTKGISASGTLWNG